MTHPNGLPLTTVLGLSRQQDGHALTRLFAEELRATGLLNDAQVYEVYPPQSGHPEDPPADADELTIRRFDASFGSQREKIHPAGIEQALATQAPVIQRSANDPHRDIILIPIRTGSGPGRMVVLDQVVQDPVQRLQLFAMVELYTNQLNLLDSRERDPLTGLLNRQTFEHLFMRLSTRQGVEDRPGVGLAILDIDHFKRINDLYGHLYGDETLLRFTQLMERNFRYTDHLFRFGGEEFIVLLVGTDAVEPHIALERFRTAVEAFDFPGVGTLTVSIGYTDCTHDRLSTTAVARADRALYFAKEHGRNRVVCATELPDTQQDDDASDIQPL